MGEFCLIAKISSEIWKKWSKKGKKWVKYIFWPSHIINNTFVAFLVFQLILLATFWTLFSEPISLDLVKTKGL